MLIIPNTSMMNVHVDNFKHKPVKEHSIQSDLNEFLVCLLKLSLNLIGNGKVNATKRGFSSLNAVVVQVIVSIARRVGSANLLPVFGLHSK